MESTFSPQTASLSGMRDMRGASALELALVVTIVFFLFLGITDLCRVLAAKMVATTAAQEALELAQRIPGLTVDRRATCAGINPASPKCPQFDGAREDVLTAAQKKPLGTLMSSSSIRQTSQSYLVPFLFRSSFGTHQMLQRDAALLMPGDFARAQFSNGERFFTNPIGQPLPPNMPWNDVLTRHPMLVYVCFEMTPILGKYFGRWRSCGIAAGYRPKAPEPVQGNISVSTFPLQTPTTLPSTTTTLSSISCPDGACQAGENCTFCPLDCGTCCGNGSCADPGEDCQSCAIDCGNCCGNGFCGDAGEDCVTCPSDCFCFPPYTCSGGLCTAPACPDGTCDTGSGESCATCPSDCGSCCGNGSCVETGENCATCVADCACAPPNTCQAGTCVGPSCGDGSCGAGEDCSWCPADCGSCCGNGICGDGGETCGTCVADCGACTTTSTTVATTTSSTVVTTTTAPTPTSVTTTTTVATTTSTTTTESTSTTLSPCPGGPVVSCPRRRIPWNGTGPGFCGPSFECGSFVWEPCGPCPPGSCPECQMRDQFCGSNNCGSLGICRCT